MFKLFSFIYDIIENMSYYPDINDNLLIAKHASYFMRFLNILPPRLASHDSSRVTIVFFAVCGLDVLDSLQLMSREQKDNIINWIYSLQIIPKENERPIGGFQGSTALNIKNTSTTTTINGTTRKYQSGHLAMTYTAIATLITLGDDLSRLDRQAIIKGVAAAQNPDGSFKATIDVNENDMRFVYCASAICGMLNDWGNVDKLKMAEYIKNGIRYDYGVSQHYEMESHGGTTFCAIASLQLSGQLDILSKSVIEKMKRWLLFRQEDGFNGRPNKPVDTCYSFWIGATLKILDAFHLSNYVKNREYVISAQNKIVGGFSKWPNSSNDPFHTYFSLCGLSFMGESGLQEVMPSLNISQRAYNRLLEIHKTWILQKDLNEIHLNIEYLHE